MIPNRGYQRIISSVFIKTGLLLFNLSLNHYSEIKNLMVWKAIIQQYGQRDINYGIVLICLKGLCMNHNKTTFGQSSIRLN